MVFTAGTRTETYPTSSRSKYRRDVYKILDTELPGPPGEEESIREGAEKISGRRVEENFEAGPVPPTVVHKTARCIEGKVRDVNLILFDNFPSHTPTTQPFHAGKIQEFENKNNSEEQSYTPVGSNDGLVESLEAGSVLP